MANSSLIKPFKKSSSDNIVTRRDREVLSARAARQETLINLGNKYYWCLDEIEREKQRKYSDRARIERLHMIAQDLEKYKQYANVNDKQR